jgi:asparaginyl-tRNA synthetase
MSSTEEEKGHSKSALKKAEKAKLIAEKKAKAEAEKAEKAAAAASAASAQLEESKSIELVEPTGVSEAVRIRIEHASDSRGKRVRVSGWVHYLRRQGNSLLFVELRDGSSLQHPLLQCVLSGDLAKTYDARTLCREASVEIFGVLMQDDRAKGGVELQADYWRLIGKSSEELENRFNQDSNPDVLLDNRHLHLRSARFSAILKLRSIVSWSFREFFFENSFFEVTPPTLVQTQVEGGSDLFKFQYFGEDAYLTQSSQLYLETTIPSIGRSFCIMPSYRAELSKTRRHLSEFTHVEGEMAFFTYDQLLDLIEDMVVSVAQKVVSKAGDLLKTVNPDFKVPEKPFLRMSYRDALKWLNDNDVRKEDGSHYEFPDDIPEKPERHMTDTINRPIFLCKFPVTQKPFYMSRPADDQEVTESVDLLMPGVGEIVGGSMREWDEEKLKKGFERQGLDTKPYYWYNELRTFGTCPHGGFGLGMERYLCWMLNQFHVRDVSLYPRFYGRCQP